MKRVRRRVDGVLLLDKAGGMTSNDALQKARRLFNAAKAGHTGTLDPMATGLLPICFGEATKFAGGLLDSDKRYEATIRLGVRTDTGDADGRVVEARPVSVARGAAERALAAFRGRIAQVPPMHSALKRDGRPLYELARQGISVERAAREVVIHALDLHAFDGDRFEISVDCSKGTYIRTLAEDIGTALGCGAHLTALRRTRIGELRIDAATTLAALEAREPAERDACLLPVDALLAALPRVALGEEQTRRFVHGQAVPVDGGAGSGPRRVYSTDGRFLGLGRGEADGVLHPARLLAGPAED